jgi:hypothetical protein
MPQLRGNEPILRLNKVQHLDIVEDLLDEDWTMAVAMRQGWTLSLVFVVGWSDRDADGKD